MGWGKQGSLNSYECWGDDEDGDGDTVDGRNPKQPPGMYKTL